MRTIPGHCVILCCWLSAEDNKKLWKQLSLHWLPLQWCTSCGIQRMELGTYTTRINTLQDNTLWIGIQIADYYYSHTHEWRTVIYIYSVASTKMPCRCNVRYIWFNDALANKSWCECGREYWVWYAWSIINQWSHSGIKHWPIVWYALSAECLRGFHFGRCPEKRMHVMLEQYQAPITSNH